MKNINKEEYNHLSTFIKYNYGINLGKSKQVLLEGRLQSILTEKGFDNYSDYYDYLTKDKTGEAVKNLLNKITTNLTFFMRETDHFTFFETKVLPYIADVAQDKDMRIWSAGCSTGEEAYTLAMIIDEFLNANKNMWNSKILATDISSKVLDICKKGIYSNSDMNKLPISWKLKYFNRVDDENSEIIERLKKEVIFRKFNLMDEVFPFKRKFHVIFCRNVMIYFDQETRRKLIKKFVNCLEPNGYLFVGHSETLNNEKLGLKYVMPAIYIKE